MNSKGNSTSSCRGSRWFSLELLKHRKSADIAGDGENLILDGISFGKFRLEKGSDSLLLITISPKTAL